MPASFDALSGAEQGKVRAATLNDRNTHQDQSRKRRGMLSYASGIDKIDTCFTTLYKKGRAHQHEIKQEQSGTKEGTKHAVPTRVVSQHVPHQRPQVNSQPGRSTKKAESTTGVPPPCLQKLSTELLRFHPAGKNLNSKLALCCPF